MARGININAAREKMIKGKILGGIVINFGCWSRWRGYFCVRALRRDTSYMYAWKTKNTFRTEIYLRTRIKLAWRARSDKSAVCPLQFKGMSHERVFKSKARERRFMQQLKQLTASINVFIKGPEGAALQRSVGTLLCLVQRERER